MNKHHGKDGKFTSGGGSGKSSTPATFQLDVNKMKKNKLPKELKKGGVDSPAYKEWIYKNWAK